MTTTRSRWTRVRWASTAVAVLATAFVVSAASPASALSSTISISPASGPVGATVTLHGNTGSDCGATLFPTLSFGQGNNGPVEFIVVPVAADGAWSATFVVPPFVGGAATRGQYGSDVTAGTWEFDGPTCVAPVPVAPFRVTGTAAAQPSSRVVGMAATPSGNGYWLAQQSGGVLAFGDARFHGSLPPGPGGRGVVPAAPISGVATTHDGGGYWLVGQDGGVYAFGDAVFYGSLGSMGIRSSGAVVGITASPDGHGYWLLGADGGVFSFGDARCAGSPKQDAVAVTALAATPSGNGYLTMPANGDVPLANGDATLPAGSRPGPVTLAALISGGAISLDGHGYWEVGTAGAVLARGGAGFFGSPASRGVVPTAPIVGMARTPDARGYWLVGADGGVFSFGDAGFHGSGAAFALRWH